MTAIPPDIKTSPGEEFLRTLDFVALDIETTGLDFQNCEIIEIAAVRFTGSVIVDRFQSFAKPKHGIPKYIQHLTHIDPNDLKAAPQIAAVLQKLVVFLGESVILGHNVRFDTGFIDHNLALSGHLPLTNEKWDTAELGRIYLPYTNDHTLGTMCRHFDIELVNAHRAEADAEATGKVLISLARFITEHYSMMTNARLLDLSRQSQADESSHEFLRRLVEWQRRHLGAAKLPLPENPWVNVIDHTVEKQTIPGMVQVFGPNGILEHRFENFEFREGQLQMGEAVKKAFAGKKHLAVEAGTGVGKSFAYLVPAMEFANKEKSKVVVSTNTKNLQEQLFFKDLPRLKDLIPLSFKAVLVKGRENYVCQRRWDEIMMEQTRGLSSWEARGLMYLYIWKLQTLSGDVSENSSFDRGRYSLLWRKINSDRFSCMGKKCPKANECFVMKLRKHIETASIVVANHSLLLADLRNEFSTLGEYSHLVVDEAHNLAASASGLLGFELSYAELANTLFQLSGSGKKRSGLLHQIELNVSKSAITDAAKNQATLLIDKLGNTVEDLRTLNTRLFQEAATRVNLAESFGKLRIKELVGFDVLYRHLGNLINAWKELMKDLKALGNVYSSFNSELIHGWEETVETIQSTYSRNSETEGKLLSLQTPDLENYALWLQNDPRPDRNTPGSSFCYAPVEVDRILYELLYSKISCIVFTSATLALRGSFKYFFNQSGLHLIDSDKIVTEIVSSPFDYDSQSKLMVSSFLPEHKDKFFLNQALGCVEQILASTEVGTMMLFTSYRDLNSVYDHIGDALYHRGRPFFAQGKIGSRSSILQEFKNHKNAVLLGTSSFWEGVDVQGESLSMLILFKLPFLVPSEPIVEAYIDKLERDGKDSFMHYMLPNALLRLRQGFGRLIRSKTDRGIVLIMDSRVSTKRYGSYFKEVLPTHCLELRSELELINEVTSFFNRKPHVEHDA